MRWDLSSHVRRGILRVIDLDGLTPWRKRTNSSSEPRGLDARPFVGDGMVCRRQLGDSWEVTADDMALELLAELGLRWSGQLRQAWGSWDSTAASMSAYLASLGL